MIDKKDQLSILFGALKTAKLTKSDAVEALLLNPAGQIMCGYPGCNSPASYHEIGRYCKAKLGDITINVCQYHRHEYQKEKNSSRDYRRFKQNRCQNPDCEWVGAYPDFILQVDHIDGNKDNNDPSNLITYCGNCHAIKTHIYKDSQNSKKRNILEKMKESAKNSNFKHLGLTH